MSAVGTVRYPDTTSPEAMTKRAWWLIALNMLVPGSAQMLAGNRGLGRFGVRTTFVLWGVAVLALLLWFLARPFLITIATSWLGLWIAQIGIVFYLGLWVVLTLDTLRLVRIIKVVPGARLAVALVTVGALVLLTGVGSYGAMVAGVTRDTVGTVFAGDVIEPPVDGRYNILLLGGDAGPDREGLRPDSISVVSIEDATGKATIFGLPRNLERIPFAEGSPMLALYPNGYGGDAGCDVDVCLLNSIYTEVELYEPELYPDALGAGSTPGIEAMRDAAEGVLGLSIQYYVLIDMQGFSQLIDALGGITIDSTGRYPIEGGVDDDGNPVDVAGWIEPGVQVMNGYTALWYARSRHGSTDYDRMARQRQVQQAILEQFDPGNVLSKFQAVAEAGAEVVRTDIPQSMLGKFLELATTTRGQEITTIEIVPPLIDVEYPDIPYIQQVVAEATAPSTPEPEDG